ncbi:MAG: hypothetical protein WCI39_09535 [Gallionellaceae bacterium]
MLANVTFRTALLLTLVILEPSVSAAQDGAVEFSGSGFLTISAGKMLNGTSATVLDRQCPCFVADYAQGSVYDGTSRWQFGPDSKLGLQGKAKFIDSRFSATAQVVARGSHNGQANIEWLYGNFQLTDSTDIQFGRKRLPLFYYSDIQDVGFAIPWTHLPPQQYGWEAVNYNGINILHRTRWSDWAATINVLAGNETVADSGYAKIYNGKNSKTSVTWNNIVGGEVSFVKNWFETRLAYIQSETSRVNSSGKWDSATQSYIANTDPFYQGKVTRQNIYSVAFNIDTDNWLARSEFLLIDRPGAEFRDHAQLLAVGRRFSNWLLMATASDYRSEAVGAGDSTAQESHISRSITVRYDIDESSDFKVQIDHQKDQSGINWSPQYGDAQLLSIAYDRVF